MLCMHVYMVRAAQGGSWNFETPPAYAPGTYTLLISEHNAPAVIPIQKEA